MDLSILSRFIRVRRIAGIAALAGLAAASGGCSSLMKNGGSGSPSGDSAGPSSSAESSGPAEIHSVNAPAALRHGIGLNFEKVTDGLLSQYEMKPAPVENGLEVEIGRASVGSGILKIVGPKSDIVQVSLTVPVSGGGKVGTVSLSRMQRLLRNLAPDWTDRDQWLNRAMGGATSMPGTRSVEEREGIQFELTSPRMTEILTLTVRRR